MKTGVKVMDAMTKSPIIVNSNLSIKDCCKIMLKESVGGVIVKDKNGIGIITEKDIIEKVVAKNLDPEKTTAKKIMTKNMVIISPEKDIYDAIIKMRDKDVRRLPVIHDGELIGLLTEKDILKIEPSLFDLLVERYEIREEDKKPIKNRY
jgi:signal-transduction protein with cAMP-binding, CBS, and nucleotidyltransferase domain